MLATENAAAVRHTIAQIDYRRAAQLKTLTHYSTREQEAVLQLFHAGQHMLDTSGGGTCGRLLLGLYNGERFPFDLTDLRRLDDTLHAAAMTVLFMDSRHFYTEVHTLLDAVLNAPSGKSTGRTLELWAHRLGLKGRCTKSLLPELKAGAV